jgi:hypothetical protein
MMWVRKIHLYSGVFFAPALLFFAFTGLLQVYGLHQDNPRTGYQPPALIARLGALHKDQTFALPHRGGLPGGGADGAKGPQGAAQGARQAAPQGGPPRPSAGQALLKLFAAACAVTLGATTLLGLYMAYALNRNPWLVNGLLAAGLIVPLILIVGLKA